MARLSEADLGTAAKRAAEAVEAFKTADPTLAPRFESSAGYAILPKVGKGGFVVVGPHEAGLGFEKSKRVGEAAPTQAIIGLHAGGQSLSEVILFEKAEVSVGRQNFSFKPLRCPHRPGSAPVCGALLSVTFFPPGAFAGVDPSAGRPIASRQCFP